MGAPDGRACADRMVNGAAVGEGAKRSPRILAVAWGRIDVEGLGVAKDVKLYPGGGREWHWSETGTRRSPGTQPADIDGLFHSTVAR
jgi:hypothetical protein